MAVIMAGCMTEAQRVNVILSMRLSLIDGQSKSCFPFTPLGAPLDSWPNAVTLRKSLLFPVSLQTHVEKSVR